MSSLENSQGSQGSSDEEIEETADESAPMLQEEIGSSANFLLGARSRFGRVIRFNNRLMY